MLPTWVIIPDRCLEEPLAVLSTVGGDDLEARTVAIPRSEALGMLGCHTSSGTVRATEYDRTIHLDREGKSGYSITYSLALVRSGIRDFLSYFCDWYFRIFPVRSLDVCTTGSPWWLVNTIHVTALCHSTTYFDQGHNELHRVVKYNLLVTWLTSLWPVSEVIRQHRSGSTMAQVIACCQMAPSHYLNQCWLICGVQWHSSKGNFTRDTTAKLFIDLKFTDN